MTPEIKRIILVKAKMYRGYLNPFPANVPIMEKTGSWFLLAKCVKNICGRVTF